MWWFSAEDNLALEVPECYSHPSTQVLSCSQPVVSIRVSADDRRGDSFSSGSDGVRETSTSGIEFVLNSTKGTDVVFLSFFMAPTPVMEYHGSEIPGDFRLGGCWCRDVEVVDKAMMFREDVKMGKEQRTVKSINDENFRDVYWEPKVHCNKQSASSGSSDTRQKEAIASCARIGTFIASFKLFSWLDSPNWLKQHWRQERQESAYISFAVPERIICEGRGISLLTPRGSRILQRRQQMRWSWCKRWNVEDMKTWSLQHRR